MRHRVVVGARIAHRTHRRHEHVGTDPELFDVLVVARNRAWAKRIHETVHADQPAIVVVGAGHLVGAGAIPQLLDARGITIRRPDLSIAPDLNPDSL